MLGQLTEERILYRCRKTVLEMLRDRGYNIGDGEIGETFEEFEQHFSQRPNISIIVKRPVKGSQASAAGEEGEEATPQMEPIFVTFSREEKLGKDAIKGLLNFMNQYSQENQDANCRDLVDAILVVKGTSSQIFRKVSLFFLSLTIYGKYLLKF